MSVTFVDKLKWMYLFMGCWLSTSWFLFLFTYCICFCIVIYRGFYCFIFDKLSWPFGIGHKVRKLQVNLSLFMFGDFLLWTVTLRSIFWVYNFAFFTLTYRMLFVLSFVCKAVWINTSITLCRIPVVVTFDLEPLHVHL